MRLLIDLFFSFAKIGLFTFGGGYAMLPLIENVCVFKKKWISFDEMMNITAIAESTPGPVAINCATFVGYKQKGVLGAIFATVGVILPSFVIIYLISSFLNNFLEITLIANAFKGIKLAVGILILGASVKMIKKMPKKHFPYAVMACSASLMLAIDLFSLNFSSVGLLLLSGAVSLAVFWMKGFYEKRRKKE